MNRTSKNREKLTSDELEFILSHEVNGAPACPDCEIGPLAEGPCGGLAINPCGSRFNDTFVFGWDRISDASPLRPVVASGDSGHP